MLKEMEKIINELYALYGATSQVVRLSEILDYFEFVAQENQLPIDERLN